MVCDYPMLREEKWFFFWSLRDQPWAVHTTEFFQPLHFSVEGTAASLIDLGWFCLVPSPIFLPKVTSAQCPSAQTALGSFLLLPTAAGGAQVPQAGISAVQSGRAGDTPTPNRGWFSEPQHSPDEPPPQYTTRRLSSEGGPGWPLFP